MKILITGVPGTGKSTISKTLNERGITSIDFSDVPDLCCWCNKITKEKIKYSPVKDIKWLDKHERICDLEKLKNETALMIPKASTIDKEKLEKRMSLIRSMMHSGIRPEWMFLTVIPVIPPNFSKLG